MLSSSQTLKEIGIPSWPPLWTKLTASRFVDAFTVNGQIGTLKDVYMREDSSRCYLLIEHAGEQYLGTLLVVPALYQFLKRQIGRTIKEIGDIQVSRNFPH
jgi:hypothetical protein